MCRFLAYLGNSPVILADLIDRPANSLIKQSRSPRLCQGINADGFGLAWYQPEIAADPGLYKSVQPAWNDANLKHLANKIKSPCFLGHVRASTVGEVSFSNCHPFVFQKYAFVHNGTIKNIERYRRAWIADLDQDLFEAIRGQTDSELLFYLILQEMRRSADMLEAIRRVFKKIRETQAKDIKDLRDPRDSGQGDAASYSLLNIAITDGEVLWATRYATTDQHPPLSLCYSIASSVCGLGGNSRAAVIASEALTDYAAEWVNLENGQIISVGSDFDVKISELS